MGGGNYFNIIRVASMNEVKNIIFSSDLNGSITPSDGNTWQCNKSTFVMWSQNNVNAVAYVIGNSGAGAATFGFEKNTLFSSIWSGKAMLFGPIIEYSE